MQQKSKFFPLIITLGLLGILAACKDKVHPELAAVSTLDISAVTDTSASGGGAVTSSNGAEVTQRGICWSTAAAPTTDDDKTSDGAGNGSFTSALTNLTPSTTYFVRAYAINAVGTSYGREETFTTADTPADLATVTTSAAVDIADVSATVNGSVTADGGGSVTVRGICYGTATGPTVAGTKTTNGTGVGSFDGLLTDLSASTTYYARAYATNSAGTAYGNEISFVTNASSVTLDAVKDASIFNNAAGNAVNGDYGSGGSQVLQVGFSSSSSMYARTLVQFDVSAIPSDAVIETASLQMTDAVSGVNVPTVSVYRLTQGWTEGTTADACTTTVGCNILGTAISPGGNDVTWNVTDYSTAVAWTNAGGTFAGPASATSADEGANLNLFSSAGLVADVQAWVSGGSTNNGWLLKIAEPTTGSGKIKRYASTNSTSTKPKLVVTYH